MAILICLVLPLFLLFGWVSKEYESFIKKQLSEQIVNSISKSEEAIYDMFRNIAGTSSVIATNNRLFESLRDPQNSYFSVYKEFDECVNYVQVNNLYADDEILITLFDSNGRCYTNWERNFKNYDYLMKEDWVLKSEYGNGHLVWNLFSPEFLLDNNEKYISAARSIYNGTLEEHPLGVLIVSMPQSHFSHVLKGFCYSEKDSVYIIGDQNKPILKYEPEGQTQQLNNAFSLIDTSESGSFTMNTDSGIKLVSYFTLNAPWTLGEEALRIVHFTDFNYVVQHMAQFSKRINIVLIFAAVIALIIVGLIVGILVKPIKELSHVMRHYKLGDSLEGLDMMRRDEIGHLNRSFKRLTENIKDLFKNLDEEYRIKEHYRYESLRSQLNPHFLFNALNTIRYISIMQHTDTITEGINALSAVLKYSIGNDEDMARLYEEIEHVKGYLEIQNMRFGQRIKLEEDFEPEIMKQYMPRFILQPIVENAVIHAFKENIRNEKECLIRLYGYNEDDIFHLYVEDNGEGVDIELLEKLNNNVIESEKRKMTGIGFSHVKEIIEMTFGKEYTLEITSQSGIGTIVHYRLPVIDDVEEIGYEKNSDCR